MQHNRVFNPYTARTVENTSKVTSRSTGCWTGMPRIVAGTNVTDGGQDHDTGYEVPKTKVRKAIEKHEW